MIRIISILCIVFLIQGCTSGKKSALVSNKSIFDPVTVYKYPPLSLPPIYYLTSEEIAEGRSFAAQSQSVIRRNFFGSSVSSEGYTKTGSSKITGSDLEFLKLLNADADLSEVRSKLDQETLNIKYKNGRFFKSLFSDYEGESLDAKLSEYKKYN